MVAGGKYPGFSTGSQPKGGDFLKIVKNVTKITKIQVGGQGPVGGIPPVPPPSRENPVSCGHYRSVVTPIL